EIEGRIELQAVGLAVEPVELVDGLVVEWAAIEGQIEVVAEVVVVRQHVVELDVDRLAGRVLDALTKVVAHAREPALALGRNVEVEVAEPKWGQDQRDVARVNEV